MTGFWLALDKPTAHTSHDVVARVRKALHLRRVGHSGTLDPDVTGVLAVAVGKATRLIQYLQGQKRYRGVVQLGISTDSQDASGRVLSTRPVPALSRPEVATALTRFLGPQQQLPPMVSAVSFQGKRLYQLARQGRDLPERPTRAVEFFSLDVLNWDSPCLELEVACSAGTYIRTLAHDLGEALGCGGHLQSLRRLEANGFRLEDCLPLEDFVRDPQQARQLPLDYPLAHWPALNVNTAEAQRFVQGQRFCPEQVAPPDQPLRVYHASSFLGMGQLHDQQLQALCVLTELQTP